MLVQKFGKRAHPGQEPFQTCLADETEPMQHFPKRQVLTFLSRLFNPHAAFSRFLWLYWQDSVLWHYPEQWCHGINSLTFTFPGELAIWHRHMRPLPSQPEMVSTPANPSSDIWAPLTKSLNRFLCLSPPRTDIAVRTDWLSDGKSLHWGEELI